MELEIFKVLEWNLYPPTLALWASWYSSQWDLYVDMNGLQLPKIKDVG